MTSIATLPYRTLFSFSASLPLLLVAIFFFSIIDNQSIFTALVYQAWAFEPTNATISQPSANETANITPFPIGFTLFTDKPSYVTGETVVFSGSIGNTAEGENATTSNTGGPLGDGGKTVRIDIYNPRGGVHASNLEASVDDSGLYSYSFSTTYPEVTAGEYTATATHNKRVAEVKFAIVSSLT
jgi:hypothetical protein